jgi:phage terminase small subunit
LPRHKKPVELKRLEGTYRSDRDSKAVVVSEIVPTITSIKCPADVKDKYCRTAYETHAKFLVSLGLLQEADSPQFTSIYVMLQEIRKIAFELEQMKPDNANYEKYIHMYTKLTSRFDSVASDYYLSPAARTKLTSDMIQIKKGQEEVESIVARKLRMKKA